MHAFTGLFKVGGKLYAARDEQKDDATALFNRRNKSPKGEVRTFNFNQNNRRDHVEVSFNDKDTGYKKQTFVYPVSGDPDYNATYNLYFNPIKLNLEGVTNFDQAYSLAMYAYRREILNTDSIRIESTDDARVLSINDKIINVDSLGTSQLYDGEVVAYDDDTPSATIITVDLPIFESVSSGTLIMRSQDGKNVQSFSCTQKAGGTDYEAEINTASNPLLIDFAVSDGVSKGTLYEFKATGSTDADEYLVKSIEVGEMYTNIFAEKYNEDTYDCDTVTIPAKPY